MVGWPDKSTMGVRNLNRHIRAVAGRELAELHMKELSGRRLVVDANNYLYRFAAEGSIVAGLYQFVSQFMRYKMEVVFVFDGRPPPEKTWTIEGRARDRSKARAELAARGDGGSRQLRRRCARVTRDDILEVCVLLNALQVPYVQADGEAEQLCSSYVSSGAADYCLSEDTDLFLYGCPAVLRYLSLVHDTVVLYPWSTVRDIMGVDQPQFVRACVATGTDYNAPSPGLELGDALELARAGDLSLDPTGESVLPLFQSCAVPIGAPIPSIPCFPDDRTNLEWYLRNHGIFLHEGETKTF